MKAYRTISRACLLSLFIVLILARTAATQENANPNKAPDPAEVEAITGWLKSKAIPLKSVEAGHGFADLQPLKKVLKDARVVGLGEATHGTREFFQFKHRMLEFLVKEMGFTVFAIEASYPACMNINDYALHGKGDRAAALASQGFWTWDTNEVSEMIEWMRAYNEKAPAGKKVKFLGYDLQHFGQGLDLVIAYLKKVAPEYAETAEAAYKPLRLSVQNYGKRSEEEINQTRARLREVIGFLAFNQTRFVRQTSAAEFELVMQHARIPLQFDDSYTRSMKDPKFAFTRDYYMAENIEYLMKTEGPGTKMVVWAHNGHVQTGNLGQSLAMGGYLRKFFGEAYYALGFSFNEGGFQSRDMSQKGRGTLTEFTLGPAPAGTGDWYFARPGIANYVVDFRSAPTDGKVAQWLASTLPVRSIGSGFSTDAPERNFTMQTVLKNHYDGMIFISKTTRARPNPTGMRGPMSE
ncbi:MAG: erythromycin esterase family protein [Blastocatellia bacterium]